MVETDIIFKSGPLVLIFLGIMAMIVVLQLIPALLIFFGTMKAVFGRKTKEIVDTEAL